MVFFSCITLLAPKTIAKKKGRKKSLDESEAEEMSKLEDNSDIKNGLPFRVVYKTPKTALVDFENFVA